MRFLHLNNQSWVKFKIEKGSYGVDSCLRACAIFVDIMSIVVAARIVVDFSELRL